MIEAFGAIAALYFTFGVGFYLGLSLKDPKGFVEADAASLIRGLLIGILFWPLGVILQTLWAIDTLRE